MTVAVIGGDRRVGEVVCHLQRLGARVRLIAVPWEDRFAGATACHTVEEALTGAAVAVLPVQGAGEDGTVYTEPGVPRVRLTRESLVTLAPGGRILAGIAGAYLRGVCRELGVELVEFREADEFAIMNSIPSAEGAIQMAMEATPVTIFGSRCLVLGFGRTGRSLALLLQGLRARVEVAARCDSHLAWIEVSGHQPVAFAHLAEAASDAEIIFNTVPAPVLTRDVLSRCRRGAVIIDVATAPGGTDWSAAKEFGIKALLAPGLPGKVAPVTAGNIIAKTVVRYLAKPAPCEERP